MNPFDQTFNGIRYQVVPSSRIKNCGDCDPPYVKRPKIRLSRELTGQEKLYVIVHEGFHALFWDMDHEILNARAVEYTDYLWQLGVRIIEE